MKLIGSSLYLTWNQLIELSQKTVGADFSIKWNAIDKGVERFNKGQSQSWANIPNPDKDGGKSLVDYDSLPETAKAKLPSREVLENLAIQTIQNKADMATRRNAHAELVSVAFQSSQKKAEIEKIRGAIAPDFNEINALVKEGVRKTLAQQTARQAAYLRFWNLLPSAIRKATEANIVEAMREDHDAQLLPGPASVTNLKNWAKRYAEGGISALLTKKVGNQNAAWSEEHRAMLFEAWAQMQKPSKNGAWEVYKFACIEKDQPYMSERTARNYLDDYLVESAAAMSRYGSKTILEKFMPHMHRHNGQYSFSQLCGDGLKVGRRVLIPANHAWTGKLQRDVIAQINMWLWFDNVTGCIVGYDFALNEPFEQGRNALKMAAKLHGVLPLSVEMDKKMLNNKEMQQLLANTGIKAIDNGGVSNPKSKMAERHNKEFNSQFRKMVSDWIDRSSKTHATFRDGMEVKEVLEKSGHKYEYPLVDDAIEDLIAVINAYNTKPDQCQGLTRLEALEANVNPNAQQVSDLERAMLFGNTRIVRLKTTSKENRGELSFQVGKKAFEYMIPAAAYGTGYMQPKMRVYYDETEPENAALYMMEDESDTNQDHFVSELIWMPTFNRVEVEMTSKDYQNLSKQQANKKAFAALVEGYIETKDGLMEIADLDMAAIGQDMMKGYAEMELVKEKAKAYATVGRDNYERSTNRVLGSGKSGLASGTDHDTTNEAKPKGKGRYGMLLDS